MNLSSHFAITLVVCCISISFCLSQPYGVDSARSYEDVAGKILEIGLKEGEAYAMLAELTSKAGHRLSGSRGAAAAVDLTRQMMSARGLDNVHFEPIMVPHWVR